MKLENFNIAEYKGALVYFVFFILSVTLTYFLIITPFFTANEIGDNITSTDLKLQRMEKSLTILKKNHKELDRRYIEKIKLQEKLKKDEKERSFPDLEGAERYISSKMDSHNIFLKTIGRKESIKESSKIYIPYIFSGKNENVLEFISQLETSPKTITFGDTPFKVQIGGISTFQGKIAINIIDYRVPEIKGDKKEMRYEKIANKKVVKSDIFSFNKKKYAVIEFYDHTKKCVRDGETLLFQEEQYRIKIDKNRVYIEKITPKE